MIKKLVAIILISISPAVFAMVPQAPAPQQYHSINPDLIQGPINYQNISQQNIRQYEGRYPTPQTTNQATNSISIIWVIKQIQMGGSSRAFLRYPNGIIVEINPNQAPKVYKVLKDLFDEQQKQLKKEKK